MKKSTNSNVSSSKKPKTLSKKPYTTGNAGKTSQAPSFKGRGKTVANTPSSRKSGELRKTPGKKVTGSLERHSTRKTSTSPSTTSSNRSPGLESRSFHKGGAILGRAKNGGLGRSSSSRREDSKASASTDTRNRTRTTERGSFGKTKTPSSTRVTSYRAPYERGHAATGQRSSTSTGTGSSHHSKDSRNKRPSSNYNSKFAETKTPQRKSRTLTSQPTVSPRGPRPTAARTTRVSFTETPTRSVTKKVVSGGKPFRGENRTPLHTATGDNKYKKTPKTYTRGAKKPVEVSVKRDATKAKPTKTHANVAPIAPKRVHRILPNHADKATQPLMHPTPVIATTIPVAVTPDEQELPLTAQPSAAAETGHNPTLDHGEYMNPQQLAYFKSILTKWKGEIMQGVDRTKMQLQEGVLHCPDPIDRANHEEEFGLELRTRDRERRLLRKIEDALNRINDEDYGYCDACGSEIGLKRLEARPTATQCIDCKTIAEVKERQTGETTE